MIEQGETCLRPAGNGPILAVGIGVITTGRSRNPKNSKQICIDLELECTVLMGVATEDEDCGSTWLRRKDGIYGTLVLAFGVEVLNLRSCRAEWSLKPRLAAGLRIAEYCRWLTQQRRQLRASGCLRLGLISVNAL